MASATSWFKRTFQRPLSANESGTIPRLSVSAPVSPDNDEDNLVKGPIGFATKLYSGFAKSASTIVLQTQRLLTGKNEDQRESYQRRPVTLHRARSDGALAMGRSHLRNSSIRVTPSTRSPSCFIKLKLLGKGDVGRVYLVKEKTSKLLYALKLLSKKEMISRKKVKRVVAEQGVLSVLHHPFIVNLYHAFQSETHLYMCMEYCAGGEFFRALQQLPSRSLPEKDARFYAAEVVCALEYLHLMGLIYRDLKPENILLHASGHIMLADFDLSKASESPGKPTVLKNMSPFAPNKVRDIDTQTCTANIRTNSFVGTEEYISPEIIRGSHYTSAIDWWTLGILIYEMMYGTTPFKGRSRSATFRNVLKAEVRFPLLPIKLDLSHAVKDLEPSPDVRALISRLLTKDFNSRLGSRFGAAEVKASSWFKSIQWALLRNQTPPIRPKILHKYDTSNFRAYKEIETEEKAVAARAMKGESTENDPPWDGIEWGDLKHAAKEENELIPIFGTTTDNNLLGESAAVLDVAKNLDMNGDKKLLPDDPFIGFESISIHHPPY